jgi:hypothetical protein
MAARIATFVNRGGPSLAIAQFRAAAGVICRAESHQLNDHTPHDQNLAHEIGFVEKTQATTDSAIARLEVPSGLARLDAELLTDLRSLLQGYPALVTAAKNGMAAYERAFAGQAARDKRLGDGVGELWTELGVPVCDQ